MRITVKANELTDVEVEKVSLVKHAANRTPFKVLKSEKPQGESIMSGLGQRIAALFGGVEEAPKIVAVLAKADNAKALFPMIKAQGFRVEREHAEAEGNAIVLKQEGYDAGTLGTVVQLSPDLAVVFDREVVQKDFCSWDRSRSFDENMQTAGFYPGFSLAVSVLYDTVYEITNSAASPADMQEALDAALKGFSRYVSGLAKVLPMTVFKMEQAQLPHKVGGRTVSADATDSITGEGDMQIKEVVKGDLDGLFAVETVAKADVVEALAGTDTAAADATETAAAAVVEGAAAAAEGDAAAAAVEGAAASTEAAAAEGDATAAAVEGAAAVEAPAAAVAKSDTNADVLAAIAALGTTLGAQLTAVEARVTKMESVATAAGTVAKAALDTARATVVTKAEPNLDQSLATLNGHQPVTKADRDSAQGDDAGVWAGLMPGITSHAASRG